MNTEQIKAVAQKWDDIDHENAMAGSRAPLWFIIEQAINEALELESAALRQRVEELEATLADIRGSNNWAYVADAIARALLSQPSQGAAREKGVGL